MTVSEKVEKIQEIIRLKITGIWVTNHDGNGHRYLNTKTGHNQRSVTTKLGVLGKPHLIKWAIRMGIEWLQKEDRWARLHHEAWAEEMLSGAQLAHLDIRDDAGGVGTVAHNCAERFINQWITDEKMPEDITKFAPENCDPRSIAAMRAVEIWFRKENITPIASELLVGDIRYSAGTLDFLYLDKQGQLCIGDFKTSNSIDQLGYSAQVAAYKYFFEGMTKLKVKHCKIILLSKEMDKVTIYKINFLPKAYKAFRNICAVYDWIYSRGEKIEKDIKRLAI